jgi:hypothetical protein
MVLPNFADAADVLRPAIIQWPQISYKILDAFQDGELTIPPSDHHLTANPSPFNHFSTTFQLPSDHQPIITAMEKNSPPPYSNAVQASSSQHPVAIEADALLDRLTERVNEQHTLGEDYPPGLSGLYHRQHVCR